MAHFGSGDGLEPRASCRPPRRLKAAQTGRPDSPGVPCGVRTRFVANRIAVGRLAVLVPASGFHRVGDRAQRRAEGAKRSRNNGRTARRVNYDGSRRSAFTALRLRPFAAFRRLLSLEPCLPSSRPPARCPAYRLAQIGVPLPPTLLLAFLPLPSMLPVGGVFLAAQDCV